MKEQKSDNPIVNLLMKQENLDLACEIYNDFCSKGAMRVDPEDPVFQFLEKSENVGLARTICKEYPGAINFLAKMQLLKAVLGRCQKHLQSNGKWKGVLGPDDDRELLTER